ncbi:BACON domain-containing carbohydrate-binding protein [Bacteroides sp.]|uniref:BACON domain-containing protein n=1 Tax=Bacteroides sp. TaxID=29523 RepID=UPI001B473EF8|nr:BACON domain-containing carbohydrate-binding protein [Bacteroides sp.]MBP6064548.1 BACON domain-containing protein [Bacteroides sp.]MBP6066709.1 BACON domain-containing protein [Bacteroides sp.]MBP6935455.1 BACON domain-containing protein [Bacteroides sp.]MBP9585351.1 BACON domain-containing protein [Bacteroides sp.]
MKIVQNLKLTFLLFVTFVFSTSCENQNDFHFTHKVMVNSGVNFISTGSIGRTIKLNINSQEDCEITANAEWFSLDKTFIPKGKSTLTLQLTENEGEPRHADINFSSTAFSQLLTVQQNAANTTFEDVTHNFYATFGTMPSLYTGLQLLTEEKPSYFFFERTNTYDTNMFPTHAQYISTGANEVQNKMRDKMKKLILEINRTQPDAIFGLITDDLRARLSYDWFVAQGIDSSRVKTSLITDGTGSYAIFNNNLGNLDTGETNWRIYENEVNSLEWDTYETTKATSISAFALPEFESHHWSPYMSTLPGYRYILQNASLLETNSAFVQEKLNKEMNTVSLPPVEILNKLSKDKQNQFRKMAKFDSETIREMFDESEKENLIIISTNPSSSIMPYILQTIEQYTGKYDIFMSIHPADPDSDMLVKLEEQGKLKLFPKGLPFEVLLWSFMDDIHAIGGAQSTVFLTLPVDKVKFMYAQSAEGMIKPLDKMFKGQEGINWMIK